MSLYSVGVGKCPVCKVEALLYPNQATGRAECFDHAMTAPSTTQSLMGMFDQIFSGDAPAPKVEVDDEAAYTGPRQLESGNDDD